MKPKCSIPSRMLRLSIAAALIGTAQATVTVSGITITDFLLTEMGVEFRIQGCFEGPSPTFYDNSLYFVNTTFNVVPFATTDMLGAASAVYSGQGVAPVIASTGSFIYGDYFFINFGDSFLPGRDTNETFAATWNSQAFDPDQVSLIDVFWGASDLRVPDSGVLLTRVVVPEPSTSVLAALVTAGMLTLRGRRLGSRA